MDMEPYILWAIFGFVLVISELFSGTFYLLMLAVAAFGASAAAWLGNGFPVQSIVAGVVAAGGAYAVHSWRARDAKQQMKAVDAGQPASFENWVDRNARLARVRYRGASWDARIDGDQAPEPGSVVYVVSTQGNTLQVTLKHPD